MAFGKQEGGGGGRRGGMLTLTDTSVRSAFWSWKSKLLQMNQCWEKRFLSLESAEGGILGHRAGIAKKYVFLLLPGLTDTRYRSGNSLRVPPSETKTKRAALNLCSSFWVLVSSFVWGTVRLIINSSPQKKKKRCLLRFSLKHYSA